MAKSPGAQQQAKKPSPQPKGSSLQRIANAARRAGRRVRALGSSVKLEPLANVTERAPGHFLAQNADPQLRVIPPHSMPVGWVQLELELATTPVYAFAPTLFYDLGKGWRREDCVHLPVPEDGKLVAFLRLPARIQRLRLDMGESRGEFRVLSMKLNEITAAEAWLTHLGRTRLGLPSWHPERGADGHPLPAQARQRLNPHLGAPDRNPEQRLARRMPLLSLYASEDNEARALGVQRGYANVDARRALLDRGVTVLILNLNKPELIVPQLDRLERERLTFQARGLRLQVIVGDTGSTDPAVLERYERLGPDVLVQRNLKYHFSRCNNTIAELAECDTLLFLNNDVIFPDERAPVLEMHDLLHAQPNRGVAGCCLFYADGLAQHLGVDFLREPEVRGLCFHPRVRSAVDPTLVKSDWRVPAVTGACLMIRHTLYADVGGMDEGYAAECQDIALCLAVDRLGYESHIAYAGQVLHLENATRPKGEENWPDRQRFLRRWGSYIEARFL